MATFLDWKNQSSYMIFLGLITSMLAPCLVIAEEEKEEDEKTLMGKTFILVIFLMNIVFVGVMFVTQTWIWIDHFQLALFFLFIALLLLFFVGITSTKNNYFARNLIMTNFIYTFMTGILYGLNFCDIETYSFDLKNYKAPRKITIFECFFDELEFNNITKRCTCQYCGIGHNQNLRKFENCTNGFWSAQNLTINPVDKTEIQVVTVCPSDYNQWHYLLILCIFISVLFVCGSVALLFLYVNKEKTERLTALEDPSSIYKLQKKDNDIERSIQLLSYFKNSKI